MSYITKINKRGVELEIHDARLDELTPSSVGAAPLFHTHKASDIENLQLNRLTDGAHTITMPAQDGEIALKSDVSLENLMVNKVIAQPTNRGTLLVAGLIANTNGGYDIKYNSAVNINAATGVLFGAAWNDFAEFRFGDAEPGYCVCEVGDGSVEKSSKRLQKGANIVSDTYGMVIGSQENAIPIAVAGRVLAYVVNAEILEPGDAMCAAADGKIDKMSEEEIRDYPDRIVGYVSEFPSYKTWNGREVKDRVWIKVV